MKLQLTLQILYHEIINHYPDAELHTNTQVNLNQIEMLSDNISLYSSNVLYCGSVSQITESFPVSCCLLLNEMPPSALDLKNYILVPSEPDIQKLSFTVQNLLISIWNWYANVLEISFSSDNFDDLLNACIDFIHSDFSFHSIYHNQFYGNKSDEFSALWKQVLRSYYTKNLPPANLTPDVLARNHSLRQLVPLSYENSFYYANNIFLNEIRMGCLFFQFDQDTLPVNISCYLQILTDCILTMYKRMIHYSDSSSKNTLSLLLSGQTFSPEQILLFQKKAGLNPQNENYRIMVIQALETHEDTFFSDQLLHQNLLNSFLDHSLSVFYKDCIVILYELQQNQTTQDITKANEQLTLFLKNTHAAIGISMPFSNLNQLPIFYEQAAAITKKTFSYSHPKLLQHTASIHEYSYYLLHDMIRNFAVTHPLEHYIRTDITELAALDQEGKNHLLLSLYYYLLNDKSHQICAEKEFVHRNTFAYRIKKALSVIRDDLSNENVRLSVLISICMYWYLHPECDPIGISEWNEKEKL